MNIFFKCSEETKKRRRRRPKKTHVLKSICMFLVGKSRFWENLIENRDLIESRPPAPRRRWAMKREPKNLLCLPLGSVPKLRCLDGFHGNATVHVGQRFTTVTHFTYLPPLGGRYIRIQRNLGTFLYIIVLSEDYGPLFCVGLSSTLPLSVF